MSAGQKLQKKALLASSGILTWSWACNKQASVPKIQVPTKLNLES